LSGASTGSLDRFTEKGERAQHQDAPGNKRMAALHSRHARRWNWGLEAGGGNAPGESVARRALDNVLVMILLIAKNGAMAADNLVKLFWC